MNEKGVYKLFLSAIKKSLGAKYIEYVVKLLALVVFSRIFTPEQFGIIAVMQVFVVFFMMLSEIGIGPAIINFSDLKKEDRNGLFSISIILAVLFSLIFYFSLEYIESFYNDTDYSVLGILICFSVLFNALSLVPLNLFYRNKKFFHVMTANIIAEALSIATISTLYIAYSLSEVWMLALIPLVVSITKFFILMILLRIDTGEFLVPGRNLGIVKEIFSFSVYQFSFNVLNYFSRNLDNLLIGKYIGMQQLGLYGKSYELMRYPLQLLTFALSPAIQPSIAKNYKDLDLVMSIHNKFSINLLFSGGAFGLLFYFLSDGIVLIVLGEGWSGVGNILTIFSVIVPIQILLSSSGGFFQGMRRTDQLFKSGVFSSFTNVTAILFGISQGSIDIVAQSLVFSFTINTLQTYYLLYKNVFSSSYITFLKNFSIGILPFIITLLLLDYSGLPNYKNSVPILQFSVNSIFILISYILLLLPFYKMKVIFE